MLVDGRCVALVTAVDGANVHDQKLLKETLDKFQSNDLIALDATALRLTVARMTNPG